MMKWLFLEVRKEMNLPNLRFEDLSFSGELNDFTFMHLLYMGHVPQNIEWIKSVLQRNGNDITLSAEEMNLVHIFLDGMRRYENLTSGTVYRIEDIDLLRRISKDYSFSELLDHINSETNGARPADIIFDNQHPIPPQLEAFWRRWKTASPQEKSRLADIYAPLKPLLDMHVQNKISYMFKDVAAQRVYYFFNTLEIDSQAKEVFAQQRVDEVATPVSLDFRPYRSDASWTRSSTDVIGRVDYKPGNPQDPVVLQTPSAANLRRGTGAKAANDNGPLPVSRQGEVEPIVQALAEKIIRQYSPELAADLQAGNYRLVIAESIHSIDAPEIDGARMSWDERPRGFKKNQTWEQVNAFMSESTGTIYLMSHYKDKDGNWVSLARQLEELERIGDYTELAKLEGKIAWALRHEGGHGSDHVLGRISQDPEVEAAAIRAMYANQHPRMGADHISAFRQRNAYWMTLRLGGTQASKRAALEELFAQVRAAHEVLELYAREPVSISVRELLEARTLLSDFSHYDRLVQRKIKQARANREELAERTRLSEGDPRPKPMAPARNTQRVSTRQLEPSNLDVSDFDTLINISTRYTDSGPERSVMNSVFLMLKELFRKGSSENVAARDNRNLTGLLQDLNSVSNKGVNDTDMEVLSQLLKENAPSPVTRQRIDEIRADIAAFRAALETEPVMRLLNDNPMDDVHLRVIREAGVQPSQVEPFIELWNSISRPGAQLTHGEAELLSRFINSDLAELPRSIWPMIISRIRTEGINAVLSYKDKLERAARAWHFAPGLNLDDAFRLGGRDVPLWHRMAASVTHTIGGDNNFNARLNEIISGGEENFFAVHGHHLTESERVVYSIFRQRMSLDRESHLIGVIEALKQEQLNGHPNPVDAIRDIDASSLLFALQLGHSPQEALRLASAFGTELRNTYELIRNGYELVDNPRVTEPVVVPFADNIFSLIGATAPLSSTRSFAGLKEYLRENLANLEPDDVSTVTRVWPYLDNDLKDRIRNWGSKTPAERARMSSEVARLTDVDSKMAQDLEFSELAARRTMLPDEHFMRAIQTIHKSDYSDESTYIKQALAMGLVLQPRLLENLGNENLSDVLMLMRIAPHVPVQLIPVMRVMSNMLDEQPLSPWKMEAAYMAWEQTMVPTIMDRRIRTEHEKIQLARALAGDVSEPLRREFQTQYAAALAMGRTAILERIGGLSAIKEFHPHMNEIEQMLFLAAVQRNSINIHTRDKLNYLQRADAANFIAILNMMDDQALEHARRLFVESPFASSQEWDYLASNFPTLAALKIADIFGDAGPEWLRQNPHKDYDWIPTFAPGSAEAIAVREWLLANSHRSLEDQKLLIRYLPRLNPQNAINEISNMDAQVLHARLQRIDNSLINSDRMAPFPAEIIPALQAILTRDYDALSNAEFGILLNAAARRPELIAKFDSMSMDELKYLLKGFSQTDIELPHNLAWQAADASARRQLEIIRAWQKTLEDNEIRSSRVDSAELTRLFELHYGGAAPDSQSIVPVLIAVFERELENVRKQAEELLYPDRVNEIMVRMLKPGLSPEHQYMIRALVASNDFNAAARQIQQAAQQIKSGGTPAPPPVRSRSSAMRPRNHLARSINRIDNDSFVSFLAWLDQLKIKHENDRTRLGLPNDDPLLWSAQRHAANLVGPSTAKKQLPTDEGFLAQHPEILDAHTLASTFGAGKHTEVVRLLDEIFDDVKERDKIPGLEMHAWLGENLGMSRELYGAIMLEHLQDRNNVRFDRLRQLAEIWPLLDRTDNAVARRFLDLDTQTKFELAHKLAGLRQLNGVDETQLMVAFNLLTKHNELIDMISTQQLAALSRIYVNHSQSTAIFNLFELNKGKEQTIRNLVNLLIASPDIRAADMIRLLKSGQSTIDLWLSLEPPPTLH